MRVHAELGPGLLETTYSVCMAHEFALRGVPFERERRVPVTYRGAFLESGFRIDLLVADEVVVEINAVEALLPVHEAQVLTYLKLSRLRVGLLLNNVRLMKDGIRRLVL